MRVFYVDNDSSTHDMMPACLGMKFNVTVVPTAEQALTIMDHRDRFDAVIAANNKGVGLKFLTEVSKKHPKTVRVLISGGNITEEIKQAISNGDITRFIKNPPCFPQLVKDLEHDISHINH